MAYNIHTVMPSGMVSKGYDCETREKAVHFFGSVVAQIRAWKDFAVDVVMLDEIEDEIQREQIR